MGKRLRNIYFTSDWHIGHKNVLAFSNRPFKDVEHMHQKLINNYNASVCPKDICYFIGDMGLCSSKIMKSVIEQLNGTKILILGNHDKGHEAMGQLGFDAVLNSGGMMIAQEMVTMTHCPLKGVFREDTTGMRNSDGTENWHGENKNSKFTVESTGQFHLHGHIHSPNGGISTRELGRQYDVGVDANDYRPVSISQIEKFIAKVKRDEKIRDDTIDDARIRKMAR